MQLPTTNVTTGSLSIYDYKIVVSSSPSDLEIVVQQLMSCGWLPTGGVTYLDPLNQPWAQTMYRIQSNHQLLTS